MSVRKPVIVALAVLMGLCASGDVSNVSIAQDAPTAVQLESVEAIPGVARVEVLWTTVSELDAAGFNVMRSTSESGPWVQANDYLIIAIGTGMSGADYSFQDTGLTGGIEYYYHLQEVLNTGGTQDYLGEWIRSATPLHGVYLPLIAR
jgi:hypothetical protein